ncbi:murein L,D-transpeptidase catalytic domain family protein [Blastomonas sp. SL216]|uniref:murein L,D-transpeptidase catalytic domain family protein n=1 Tax=Blastomonas sp. SL216 TaxID=2995169 RepID=UPI002377247F|nr:murein L,D-transpeptidase catalytic domain family protein [Blastomonas sp. SL216]
MTTDISRRQFISSGAAASVLASGGAAFALPSLPALSPAVRRQALAALEQHRARLMHVDRIGIVDFTWPSSAPRLFILDVASGTSQPHLVAHGRGSDPTHTGWALRFSNEPGSLASSSGAFATGAEYTGKHGRSMRLSGLDPENGNAESRAIVVHAAAYVGPEIVASTGKLGRSLGCFAVSPASLGAVLEGLGTGRLIYAAKG